MGYEPLYAHCSNGHMGVQLICVTNIVATSMNAVNWITWQAVLQHINIISWSCISVHYVHTMYNIAYVFAVRTHISVRSVPRSRIVRNPKQLLYYRRQYTGPWCHYVRSCQLHSSYCKTSIRAEGMLAWACCNSYWIIQKAQSHSSLCCAAYTLPVAESAILV